MMKLKNKVATELLIQQNELISKCLKTVKDKKTLGLLLADFGKINEQMIRLSQSKKINFNFVRDLIPYLSILIKDVISKWLYRYILLPLTALSIC